MSTLQLRLVRPYPRYSLKFFFSMLMIFSQLQKTFSLQLHYVIVIADWFKVHRVWNYLLRQLSSASSQAVQTSYQTGD